MNRDIKRQYTNKLLEDLDIVFGHILSNRKDLLSATNSLLDSYETLLSGDYPVSFGNSDGKQSVLLKSIIELRNELNNFQPETNGYRDSLIGIRTKISNLASEIDIALRDGGGQSDNSTDELATVQVENDDNMITNEQSRQSEFDDQLLSDSIPTTSSLKVNRKDFEPSLSVSPVAFVSDDCHKPNSSESATNIGQNVMTKLHHFELFQNKLQFSKCYLCNNTILPLKTYQKCTKCDFILDQNCHQKIKVEWSILACKPILKKKFALNSNAIVLLKKCFCQIEQRGIEHRYLYTTNNNDQEACKLLDKYLGPSNSAIAISKLNINTICAMVINMLKRLDDSLIPSHQWNDFAKLSGNQWSNEEKVRYVEESISNGIAAIHRYALAMFMIHVKHLLVRNYSSHITKQILMDVFAKHLIRCPDVSENDNKQMQIKIFNVQADIMSALLNINIDFWKRCCEDR
ncbi:uncharacterized protein LOC142598173 [Dermatophagoides farinae]|uniref:uncharacterized protein LOC142598173 n=1 Tax=Dermatophagoides farinae TaxID=6954 RepID=UPI003F5E1DF9